MSLILVIGISVSQKNNNHLNKANLPFYFDKQMTPHIWFSSEFWNTKTMPDQISVLLKCLEISFSENHLDKNHLQTGDACHSLSVLSSRLKYFFIG